MFLVILAMGASSAAARSAEATEPPAAVPADPEAGKASSASKADSAPSSPPSKVDSKTAVPPSAGASPSPSAAGPHDHAAKGTTDPHDPKASTYYDYASVGLPRPGAFSCHPDGRPCEHRIEFSADPVADGALLAGALGFAGLSEAILSTGEIRPQQIDAKFDTSHLLPLDRSVLKQNVDTTADSFSNAGMYLTLGFALVDTVASGYRDDRNAAIVDAVIYSESIAFSWALTNLAKIGFRRPRPIAYIERERAIERGQDPATYSNTSTDSALSFYSGHTSISSTVWAAATYLAFARSPHTLRPWATLTAGLAMTSFIGVERVRGGAHFPTDVIAGGLAGIGVGVLVAHLHRYDVEKRRPMWISALPVEGGAVVSAGGLF